ncbi:MAG: PD40 domain-containing protein, partial [Proteobacteria bacterium]|nr:PD40 domain-containing protein [Pseudomonadota bacterium]
MGADAGGRSHRWPAFLPDGKTVLFTATPDDNNYDEADIVALSLDTLEQKSVLHGATFARYVPTGHIVFARSGTLMAVAFDADKLTLSGTPVPLLEGIMGVPPMGNAQYCFSTTGTFLYLSGGAPSADEVPVWIDRSGAIDPISQLRREYFRVRLSPDGERIAAAIMDDAQYDIWILEI